MSYAKWVIPCRKCGAVGFEERKNKMAKWLYEIKGWGKVIESEEKFVVKRDKLVALLRESDWFKADKDEYDQDELESAVDDLEYAGGAEEADDDALYRIYNQADEQRVWLSPF